MVRVSPGAAEQHLLVRDEPAQPHGVHVDSRRPSPPGPRRGSEVVASGMSGLPASARAAATSCAVRVAVPEGASTLCGWCSSTISTDSKYGAAAAAKRIISTAAIPKFGAISTPVPGEASSQARTWSSFSASKPVVPTTAVDPVRRCRNSRLPMTDVRDG